VNGAGEPIIDDSFMLIFNPHHEPIQFHMPEHGAPWEVLLDSQFARQTENPVIGPGQTYELIAHAAALLREVKE
jgi:glycogen operon protein